MIFLIVNGHSGKVFSTQNRCTKRSLIGKPEGIEACRLFIGCLSFVLHCHHHIGASCSYWNALNDCFLFVYVAHLFSRQQATFKARYSRRLTKEYLSKVKRYNLSSLGVLILNFKHLASKENEIIFITFFLNKYY